MSAGFLLSFAIQQGMPQTLNTVKLEDLLPMKASEIAAVTKKIKTESAHSVVEESAPVLQEAKKPKQKVAGAPAAVAVKSDIFGVDDPNGHVMRRIRSSKPHLLQKLQNWD